ncbi:MAG: DUF1638 domain-containing protein [Chloroflexota bacterium]|nr:DUF1638 domain-containing protein [Chloroflexota bacterium]
MRAKIIACETVGEEIRGLIPDDIPCKFLEFGLHLTPENLNLALQREIDETQEEVDTILFGYGMCSKGTIGLEARDFRLVIPRVDDCIALFLGSRVEYAQQCRKAPGTFYLTKGWIECGDDPYTEYLKLREKYGDKKAYRIEKTFIRNYTRLALINTGNYDLEKYRKYARKMAELFGLMFEEIPGANVLIRKLITGDWDEEFVIVEPGGRVRYDMFFDGLRDADV